MASRAEVRGLCGVLQGRQGLVEVVLPELALFIHHHVHAITPSWKQIVLERNWALVRVNHMTRLMLDSASPSSGLRKKWLACG